MTVPETQLSDDFLRTIRARLHANQRVRRTLPLDGRLHIDRQVPFLVVYRHPVDREDEGTSQLVLGEASYLFASASEEFAESLHELVCCVVETLSGIFNAFLIVELWSAAPTEDLGLSPAFRVVTPDQQASLKAVETLADALEKAALPYYSVELKPENAKTSAPPDLPPLLSPEEANQWRCFTVGLELPPLYRSDSGAVYPALLRDLHQGISRALKQTFFAFTQEHTEEQPTSFFALGRRAVVNAVSEVDKALSDISGSFDFLLGVTPVNADAAWEAFKESGYQTPPEFRYRQLSIDPELLKRRLYNVPLEKIEDPTLARIFREKLRELDRQLTMLSERNTHRFLYGSLQLYGEVDDALLRLAEGLLITLPSDSRRGVTVDAAAFTALAEAELDYYRQAYPQLASKVEVRDDVTGLLVSRGDLLIGHTLELSETRVNALLQHEVGTHVLTYINGSAQPFGLLATGLAGYEVLQEGLAVLAEYLVGGLSYARLRLLAARVVAVARLTENTSFIDVFHELSETHGLRRASAFRVATRVYRGGGFTKDVIYLKGLSELLTYLDEGGELNSLYLGKLALQHVPLIEELRYREVLRAPPLLPRYLSSPDVGKRLEKLAKGLSLLDFKEN